jgi:ubiquinone/menaquinone biosynthesis C-methylase UbiE
MTEKWYRAVLERMDEGAVILDVGIGTAGVFLHSRLRFASERHLSHEVIMNRCTTSLP